MRILSSGGGLDSFAMLLGALDRGERPDAVVFADVGSCGEEGRDGEWPSTYRHLREVVIPLCARESIPFTWLGTDRYPIRGMESLLAYFEAKSIMPTRMSRLCTSAAKVERIQAWMGAELPPGPKEVWIGFEANEADRAAKDPHATKASRDGRRNRFPLIEWGLCRCRCEALVRAKGYPVPRKSACMFCPFATRGDFQTLARELPDVFERVAAMEAGANRTRSGKRITFGYVKGDETDPSLPEWIAKPYRPRPKPCRVCGAPERVRKEAGCEFKEAA